MGGLVCAPASTSARRDGRADGARGARLVMCGTPHQGAHSMVENMVGKGDTLRMLVRLTSSTTCRKCSTSSPAPRPPAAAAQAGFVDTFQASPTAVSRSTTGRRHWGGLKAGEGLLVRRRAVRAAEPGRAGRSVLAVEGRRLGAPSLPEAMRGRASSVRRRGQHACGVRVVKDRLKMVGTARGDGTVTWDSGRINASARTTAAGAARDLLATKDYFSG